jgi:hypothetical protein
MTIRNRELSQFGSFIYIDNNTKDIGITTEATPYVGIGTTNATSKFHVVGETKLEGDVNVTGISTFTSDLDINASVDISSNLNLTGLSTFSSDVDINASINVQDDLIVGENFSVAGVSTFASNLDINASVDISNNLNVTGLSTFASNVDINASVDIFNNFSVTGVSTFASNVDINASVDISNNLSVSGITTLASSGGITTTGGDLYVGGDLYISDDIVFDELNARNINVTGVSTLGIATINELYVSGVSTFSDVYVGSAVTISAGDGTVGATTFYGNFVGSLDGALDGNAGTATSLETARDFSITGDFITASIISFDGTDNVAFAATITSNSVGLGTYTSGDYVKSVSGVTSEIVITGGTGESSTPIIGISSNLILPGNLIVNGISTFNGITSFTDQVFINDINAGIVSATEFYLGGSLLVDAALEIWQPTGGDDIYRRLGNVGIGTSTSLYKLSVNGQIESQAEQGTAPFVVRSTTNVPNLNADTVDGRHAPAGDIVGTIDSQTLTNKSINLSFNTLTGTVAQFNTALSDDDFATLNNAVTLTNKTLTSPSIGIITNTGGTSQTIPTGIGTLVSTSSVGVITTGMIAASAVSNSQLVNSTISGVSLGGNLFNHSPGSYITGNAYNGSSAETWGVNATSANTADTIVARDSSGHFSAGDITAQNVTVSAGGTFFGDGRGLTNITADAAVKVSAADTSTTGPFFLTFVDSNNTPAEYETLYTDGGITYDALNARLGIGSAVPTSTLSVEGSVTASGGFVGNVDTATKLQTSRIFQITGDVVASPISFDGTGNVSLAATIQPNSVGLGTDTTGDYVETISGTLGQITITGGTGERSTPVISISDNPSIPGNVTIANDLQVNNDLNVSGNITIGGTTAIVFAQEFRVADKDIILGFSTDTFGNDISNDNTANGGGIAIASTEGTPLACLICPGINTFPGTYKQILWFKEGSFAGLNTDAWLSNYAIGIGSTQVPNNVRLAAGGVQITKDDIIQVGNINASGIVTANAYYGDGSNLVGAGSTVFNDTTTDQEYYPLFTAITSGTISASGISTSKLTYNPSSGEMTAVNFNSTSDENLKTNIQTVENSLNIVEKLRGVSFDWKESGKSSYGVIAQELEQVLPELVNGVDQKSVNYNGIIGVLIEAIKELREEIEELKSTK